MAADRTLVREAFVLSGEKHFAIARCLYPLVFGRRWRDTILAFAYLKCLDDAVDEDADQPRALATLDRQQALMAACYAGADVEAAGFERFGQAVFAADRGRGGALRSAFEVILASMAFDTRRRGARLDAAALDAYLLELGQAVFALFAELATPGARLPPPLIDAASRAYLYADALIDLRHDLSLGLINVPREDGDVAATDDGARAWIAVQVPTVLAHFDAVRALRHTVQPWTLRTFVALYLAAKRRKLDRFLAGLNRPAPASAARAAGSDAPACALPETPAPLSDAL